MYPVECVLRVREDPSGMDEYYIKYKNYPKKYNQWVSSVDMTPELREAVERRRLLRAKARRE